MHLVTYSGSHIPTGGCISIVHVFRGPPALFFLGIHFRVEKNYGISSCDFKNPLGEFLLWGKAAKLCSAEWHILNVIHAVIISYLEIALLLFPARDKCPISLKWFAGGLLHQLTPESRIISPCEWTWSIIYTVCIVLSYLYCFLLR